MSNFSNFTAELARQRSNNAKKSFLQNKVPEYISKILEHVIEFSEKGRDSCIAFYPWCSDDDTVMEKLVMTEIEKLGYQIEISEHIRGFCIKW